MRWPRAERNARAAHAALVVAALAGVAFYAAIFFPGTVPFDSAYQWWQARGHTTTNIHGIGMLWLWRASDALASGPAPMFVAQLGLLWLGLVLIALRMNAHFAGRLGLLIAATAAPVVLVVYSSVLSDAMLMSVLCCAIGACAWMDRTRGRWLAFVVLALLFFAVLLRKNALPAVLPIVCLVLWRGYFAPHRRAWRCLWASVLMCAAMQLAGGALQRTLDKQYTIFAATAMWDLAAISIDSGQMLWPASMHAPSVNLDALRQAFVPYANTSVFADPLDVVQPFLAPDDPRNGQIRRAWLAAIFTHPGAYLAHRWRVVCGLFGSKPAAWPRELVYFPASTQYADNPAFAANTSALHAWFAQRIDAWRSRWVLAAWPYLLLSFTACVLAWRRRHAAQAEVALATALSGLCYVAPLAIVAPSVELRYLGWMCLAAIIGCALALTASRELTTPPRASTLRAT